MGIRLYSLPPSAPKGLSHHWMLEMLQRCEGEAARGRPVRLPSTAWGLSGWDGQVLSKCRHPVALPPQLPPTGQRTGSFRFPGHRRGHSTTCSVGRAGRNGPQLHVRVDCHHVPVCMRVGQQPRYQRWRHSYAPHLHEVVVVAASALAVAPVGACGDRRVRMRCEQQVGRKFKHPCMPGPGKVGAMNSFISCGPWPAPLTGHGLEHLLQQCGSSLDGHILQHRAGQARRHVGGTRVRRVGIG